MGLTEKLLKADDDSRLLYVYIKGRYYNRIRVENIDKCESCNAASGELHTSGCSNEKCPSCGDNLYSCSCMPRFE